jgi:hypothetical protein
MAMAKSAKQSLVVTVSKDRHLNDVVHDLKKAGLEVEGVLDAIGVVTGSASTTSIAGLRKVRGVADVSSDHKVDIGPPDAPIS